ncbi:carboxylate--amine ligase [Fusibacter ferrireducens]|uniref:ATP-grasp domain-containing protein n=1 Tax=Fusibacter ferrireducens TaxID=2785058 RepID=A0ABR9ZYZ9_9FIRM|nr:ATP-grasp domain-containing protein [Fusibacter ferrireducens]MBF4695388.1 ATP-grasp domain-containing protein [Fusibacter ferrireducens]
MREVVITDVRYRMTLTAIWSLGKKGIAITAVEFEDSSPQERLGFYSKYVTHCRIVPNPKDDEILFINGLMTIGKDIYSRTGEKPVLIVTGSKSMAVVTKSFEKLLPYYEFNIVDEDTYYNANNTYKLSEVANMVKVPFPNTTFLQDDETIFRMSKRIQFPVVIKYREGEKLTLKAHERYKIVHRPEEFVNVYTMMHEIQPKPLVQEYIKGAGYGVSVVFDQKQRPVEIFCHRRIREYPVSGGPSTFCESIWDERMVAYAIRLLEALKWTGFAMVEFKGDLKGDLRLMEINPRFWGSMPLSLIAGCDMPFAYYKSVMALKTKHLGFTQFRNRYRLHSKMQYLFQDILSVRGYLKRNRYNPSILFIFIRDLLNPNVKDGLFRWTDPQPGIMYIRNAVLGHSKRE